MILPWSQLLPWRQFGAIQLDTVLYCTVLRSRSKQGSASTTPSKLRWPLSNGAFSAGTHYLASRLQEIANTAWASISRFPAHARQKRWMWRVPQPQLTRPANEIDTWYLGWLMPEARGAWILDLVFYANSNKHHVPQIVTT